MKALLVLLLALALTACGQAKEKNPTEIGTIKWSRDLETALKKSKESGKPIFLLFQEVPG